MPTTYRGRVTDEQDRPIRNAEVRLHGNGERSVRSGEDGTFEIRLDGEVSESARISATAFGVTEHEPIGNTPRSYAIRLPLGLNLAYAGVSRFIGKTPVVAPGRSISIRLRHSDRVNVPLRVVWSAAEAEVEEISETEVRVIFPIPGAGRRVEAEVFEAREEAQSRASVRLFEDFSASDQEPQAITGEVGVHGDVGINGRVEVGGNVAIRMRRTAVPGTLDQALWFSIRNRTHAISFRRYYEFMRHVLRGGLETFRTHEMRELGPINAEELRAAWGTNAYRALKYLTEVFLLRQTGVRIDDDAVEPGQRRHELDWYKQRLEEYLQPGGGVPRLPYLRTVIDAAFPWLEQVDDWRGSFLMERIDRPLLIELIGDYWREECGVMQTINLIAQRFQNVCGPGAHDPLANFELDPLRRLNNWIWGFIADESNRTTVRRRAYEYLHEYGLPLYGRAVGELDPAGSRSRFLEAFHNLLYQASEFYKQDDHTTIIPDAHPVLNALKEVHLILAHGASNLYGDGPYTVRVETLLTQFILAQPAIGDFLQRRTMVPYQEEWMPQVEAMRVIQVWPSISVNHFRDLAVYGEQLVLSVRFGNWIDVVNSDDAANWARDWRMAAQAYIYAYRAVTGVDLTTLNAANSVDATYPAYYLKNREAGGRRTR